MEKKNKRDKMPIEQRAKQFMPFAAVVGLEDALRIKEIEIEESHKPEYKTEREVDEND